MPATTPKQNRVAFNGDADNGGDTNGRPKIVYVRCDLSADQKKELAEWANSKNADDFIDYLNQLLAEGYILSAKQGKETGYQASLTHGSALSVQNPNGGKSLVTRASTPERAMWSLLYKHYEVLGKDWKQASTQQELDW